jgi:multidrug efflux pump subunit AcrB
MWIVRLALRRPYTFVVMAVLIAILGGTAIVTMPVDIFPYIDIPVVSIIWQYTGLPPEEMEKRMMYTFERNLTQSVNDIEHIETQTYLGVSVTRVYFHPNVQIDMAVAQITAASQVILRILPPGTTPPNILKFDAASVPVLQIGVSSDTMSEQEIDDWANNFIRVPLATVQGASVSNPYGGKYRAIMVDLNLDELYAKQLSPSDVSNALGLQNLILPAGTAKLANIEYQVRLNSSPIAADDLNNLPIKTVNGSPVYIKDVAHVRDGYSVQNNIVRTNGVRGALMTVIRNGKASTLSIVEAVKAALPGIMQTIPPALKVTILGDQSLFVKASIQGVLREGAIAACLTGLMILLFLGSWRSTLIVCISIPLSILTSICILSVLGETINVMTLGGLALAVGILVDDATVEIENTHRNMGMRKPLVRAVLDGAQQIAIPAFVSTLAICIVFVPVLLLTGAAKYLFTPLAMAVVFAMLASYLLSRTLIPTMVHYLLKVEVALYQKGQHGESAGGTGIFWRSHYVFNRQFEKLRFRYTGLLDWALDHRAGVLSAFMIATVASMGLVFLIGEDFFPNVDSGQLRLHARAPAGTRVEETEVRFSNIEREIRDVIPPNELNSILDNIGLPPGGTNLAQSDMPTISAADGEILVSLNAEKHGPTAVYTQRLRKRLNEKFPDMTFFFEAADITNQILNFGLAAPIDLQVVGRNATGGIRVARELADKIRQIPGTADVHIHQVVDAPEIRFNIDRSKAMELGMTQSDVSNSMLISLSGTSQVAPNYWLAENGVSYNVTTQTPQYKINSLDALLRTPISVKSAATSDSTPGGQGTATAGNASIGTSPSSASQAYGNPGAMSGSTQLLSNLATVTRDYAPVIVNHYNVQPVFDVFANVDRRDLGGVGRDVEKIMQQETSRLPRGTTLAMRGQLETMQTSFFRLGVGMVFAVVLVYLLMAVNFQSWLDPFIILTALPGAMAGILWMLFVTQTTLSVPSLMGAIMCVGVATANSILMVVFANDERLEGKNAREAALSAGYTRIRPVLMTATAMILGMLPMSLGLGEGGEQNAPLGRAVIGGLLFATVTTLIVVPIIYSYLRSEPPVDHERRLEQEEREGLPESEWNVV